MPISLMRLKKMIRSLAYCKQDVIIPLWIIKSAVPNANKLSQLAIFIRTSVRLVGLIAIVSGAGLRTQEPIIINM